MKRKKGGIKKKCRIVGPWITRWGPSSLAKLVCNSHNYGLWYIYIFLPRGPHLAWVSWCMANISRGGCMRSTRDCNEGHMDWAKCCFKLVVSSVIAQPPCFRYVPLWLLINGFAPDSFFVGKVCLSFMCTVTACASCRIVFASGIPNVTWLSKDHDHDDRSILRWKHTSNGT